jgi:hypothetical protein
MRVLSFTRVINYQEMAMPRRSEAGQALIMTAAALVVLMGFAGLAIDMGVMRHNKRLEQTAADAAAIAGASNLPIDGVTLGGITAGAQDAATRVGFTDNSGGQVSNCTGAAVGTICVQVNSLETTGGPQTGPHQSNAGYVEVLVAEVYPTYFMKILGINSETITARAVAASLAPAAGNGCLYTLGAPSGPPEGLNISGSATLNAPNCRILDDGDFTTAGGTLTAYSIGVSGSGTGRSVTCIITGPCPTFGIPASSDPLQFTPAPPAPNTSFGTVTTAGMQTLQPGAYSCIIIGSGSIVTLQPGIYYINGCNLPNTFNGVSIKGSATVLGTGVMVYLTGASLPNGASIDTGGGASNIQLSAPNTGPYVGILVFQDPNDTSSARVGGDNNSFFDGALYFPEGQLTLLGSSGGAGFNVAFVDADAVVLSGNTTVNLQGSAALPPGVNLITNATLVE